MRGPARDRPTPRERTRRAVHAWTAAVGGLVACGSPPLPIEPAPTRSSNAPVVAHGDATRALPEGRIAARAVAVANGTACALLVDGSVWCWGNVYQHDQATIPLVQAPLPKVKAITAMGRRTYALTDGGDVYEWGFEPLKGALDIPFALDVHGVKTITGVGGRVCFVFEGGAAECRDIGSDETIVRSAGVTAAAVRPMEACFATADAVTCGDPARTEVRALPGVVALAASRDHTCALTSEGFVVCWSWPGTPTAPFGNRLFTSLEGNDDGVCARGQRDSPVCLRTLAAESATATTPDAKSTGFASPADALHGRREVTSVALATEGGCFVEAGIVWCWGDPVPFGEAHEPVAIDLGDLTSFRSARGVAVGRDHKCLLGTDDLVRCWGGNAYGALGVGDGLQRLGPERWRGVGPVEKIAANASYSCAITKKSKDDDGGRLVCAGTPMPRYMRSNCVTSEPNKCPSTPALVSTGVADVVVGGGFACLLDTDGGVRCWGSNEHGELGAGDTTMSDAPRPVVDATGAPLQRVKKIAAGTYHACAIVEPASGAGATAPPSAGGDLVCWGYDDPGVQGRAIGDGGKEGVGAMRVVATPVPMSGRVVDVGEACAILEGGEARCWGRLPTTGDFAILPTRIGACGVKATKSGCLLGDAGIACVVDPPAGGQPVSPWRGPPLEAWDVNERASCVVTADHHVGCRSRRRGAPQVGDGGPGLAEFTPKPDCPEDAPTGAAPPLALYAHAIVTGPGGVRNLTEDEVKTLASDWSGPLATSSCEGVQSLWFDFQDMSERSMMRLVYVGPPCDGLRETESSDAVRRLSPTGKKVVRKILSALSESTAARRAE